jgi:hypothetical protein
MMKSALGRADEREARSELRSRQLVEAVMQHVVLSTDIVPEKDRFSYWRETVGEGVFGVSPERDKDRTQEVTYNASIDIVRRPSFVRLRGHTDGCPAFRRPRDVARLGHDQFVWVYRESGDGVWFKQDQHEFGGLTGLVKAYLDAFDRQAETLDDREAGFVADHFCRLLAVACGAAAGEHQESIHAARLAEAKRYIDLNLADPTLTPEKAAMALKISVRSLHLLFEPSGTTFAQYVLRRRPRGMPRRPHEPRRSVRHGHRLRLGLQQPDDLQPDIPAGLQCGARRNAPLSRRAVAASPQSHSERLSARRRFCAEW